MYAKIFTQIYDSSIVENPEVRFTFMDLLVLADCNGVVDMTHEAIARRTNRPLELIRSTIAELEAPDARSRTPDAEGCRIKRLDEHRDWGWMIVNYDRFRKTASEEQRREKTNARVQRYRKSIKAGVDGNAVETHSNAPQRKKRHAEAEAEAEAEEEVKGEGGESARARELQESENPGPEPGIEAAVIPSHQNRDEETAIASLMTSGIPTEFSRYVYADWSSRDGRDASNVPVTFVRYAVKRWTREQIEWKSGAHKGRGGNGKPVKPQTLTQKTRSTEQLSSPLL